VAEVIDIYFQQLREIQEDAVRLYARAIANAGQPEGEMIGVILEHLNQAMHKLEDYQAVRSSLDPVKPARPDGD
jgi:hypothetical protein